MFFIIFLSFIILFSGCVSQEQQFKNKSDCLSLTSYSFQRIPECTSQEQCFKEVEKLFVFPADSFSGSSYQALNSYKNNLASSWLYFNKSLAVVKEINHLCETNNFSSLPEKTNELGFFLQKAFDFVDKANLDSFSFILLEKEFLDSQDIMLIPEEPLFDDFVLFNQNINELSVPSTEKNSSSYVSAYFSASAKFNEFSSRTGFNSLYLNEFSSADLVGFYNKDALNLIDSKEFYVPLLKKTVSSLFSYVLGFDDLGRSLAVLKKMPSNELFDLFGGFASSENSVAFNFSELVSNTALHKNSLKENNKTLSSETDDLIPETSSELDSLSFSSINKFDSNVLYFLFENLERNSISEKEHGVDSIETFVFDSEQKLFFIKNSFNELKRQQYFDEITLGELTNSLKKTNSELVSLNQDIDYYSDEIFVELTILCDTKTKSIEQEFNSVDFSGKPWSIVSIASKTAVKISEYNKSSGEEKLLYCSEIISSFNELSLALKDNEKFFLESGKSFDECFSSLEKLFYSKNLLQFIDAFYSLKSMKEQNLDIAYLSNSCSELKQRIINNLYSNNQEIKEINLLYADSKKLLSRIVFLNKLYPEFFSSEKTSDFNSKLSEISKHFCSGALCFEFFNDSSKEFSSLKELNNKMSDFFVASFEKLLSSDYESKLIPLDEAVLGNEFPARQRIFFSNPLNEKISYEFSFLSPKISGKVLLQDSCINKIVEQENNSRIFVSCIPADGLMIESESDYLIPFTFFQKLIESSQDKIVFRKLIKVDSSFSVSRIKAVIPLDFDSDSAFAFFDSEKIPVSVSSKKAVFFLEDLKQDSEIELYYSVFEPVSVSLSEKSRNPVDQNTFLMEFLVQVKNNLGFDFDSMKVSVPLNNFDSISSIELFDSYSKIPFDKTNNKLVFSVSLNKFQSKEFILKFKINDLTEYSDELKQSIISDLVFLSNSLNQETSSKAENLLQKTQSVSGFDELLELRQETDFLLLKENSSVETEFISIKNSVEEKIASLEKTVLFLSSTGFNSESNKLSSELNKQKSVLMDSLSLSKEDALPLLLSLNSSLEDFSESKPEKFLLDKRDILIEKANELSGKTALLNDPVFSGFSEEISKQDANFFSLFSRNDYFNAAISLNSIEEKINSFADLFEEKILEKKQVLAEKSVLIEEKKELIQKLFSGLETALSESSYYIAPITEKRLSFLMDSFKKIKSVDLAQISDADLFSLEEKLIKTEKELTEIEQELDFSLNKMKEDAKVFLLSAKLSGSEVFEAQELFNNGKYIDSINLSFVSSKNSGTGFVSLNGFDLPLLVYPLIGLIFFIAFRKFVYKKKKKRKPARKKISSFPA